MRTFAAGIWSRRWLNVGIFVLGTLAIVVAVATPLYARSSGEHLLDQRVGQRPATEVGLNVEVGRLAQTVRVGPVPPLTELDRAAMLDRVGDLLDEKPVNRFWLPTTSYLIDGVVLPVAGRDVDINLYWRQGMCARARVHGRCPQRGGEALVQAKLASTLHKRVGDTIDVEVTRTRYYAEKSGAIGQHNRQVARPFTITGTYTIPDESGPAWFDPGRTGGDPQLRPPSGTSTTSLPAPALLVGQSSMTGSSVVAGGDRPIDASAVDIGTMDGAQKAVETWQQSLPAGPPVLPTETIVDLRPVFTEVRAEQSLLSRVTLAAVVPLVVLALLLVYVLVGAAAEVRRSHVALAKLRGFSTARVVRFAVAEPFLVIALVLPVGAVLAVGTSRMLVRIWLGTGTALVITPLTVISGVVVTAAALVAAFVAVLGVVREPLADSLATASRRRSSSRWALLGQGAVVMLAIAAVVQLLSSKADQSSSLLELLSPLFIGLGVSVLAIGVLGWLGRLWMVRTTTRGGVASYLSSRRLVRRGDLVQLVLPLLLAASMASFAASSWKVADDWRVSKASAIVGAATVYYTDSDPARLLRVTHQVDPEGRYLAAAAGAAPNSTEGGRVALVDSDRFARVLSWDDQWSSRSQEAVQRMLVPRRGEPVTFTGSHVRVELTDVRLRASLHLPLEMWMRYTRGDTGKQSVARLGQLPKRGETTLDGFVSGCSRPCSFEQLFVSGSSVSVTNLNGRFTIASIAADGDRPGRWRVDEPGAWRVARPFPTGSDTPPAVLDPGAGGLAVEAGLGSSSSIVRMTTDDEPEYPPLVATTTTRLTDLSPLDGKKQVQGASILGAGTPMSLVGRTRALPLVGSEGGLSDLRAALREYGDQATNVFTSQLLAGPGTPKEMLAEVRDAGVSLTNPRTRADELHELRSDAFSLGWKVFMLVGILTLLLAFVGVLVLAVVQLRWRSYEVAALRVVGVRRSHLRAAILREYLALLGVAVFFGAASAVTALVLVLPSIDIGEKLPFDPAVDYSLRWPVIGGVVGAVLVVVLLIALWISRRTVQRGTPATLRQTDDR